MNGTRVILADKNSIREFAIEPKPIEIKNNKM